MHLPGILSPRLHRRHPLSKNRPENRFESLKTRQTGRWSSVNFLALLTTFAIAAGFSSSAVAAKNESRNQLSKQLRDSITWHSDGKGLNAFILPDSRQYRLIPQDPKNPITSAKVKLGQQLFHETALGLNPQDDSLEETYSCASCHHVAAGFKAGVPQGIGEGGSGFGDRGEGRVLADSHAAGNPDGFVADFQPIASPTVLNSAYQDVMLWNGSFGNRPGSVNGAVDSAKVSAAGPAGVFANDFGMSGVEIQAIAGTKVHRLRMANSIIQSNSRYQRLFRQAYPRGVGEIPPHSEVDEAWLGAALAIAAYERTVLANQAPFQRWLRGNNRAMSKQQLKGGLLFFGKADCASCHTGPALSSMPDASDDRIFFNVGFNDLDSSDSRVHGVIDDATKKGRGGFTGRSDDDYKFKVAQLYNLKDAPIYGHGASFHSVRDVIEYKNDAEPQSHNTKNLATEFSALHLSDAEIDDLVSFVEDALHDKNLSRYVPARLPSGGCFPVADLASSIDLGCFSRSRR